MSASEPMTFPCPKCGTSRGELEGTCPKCHWGPNVPAAAVAANLYPQSLAKPTGHLMIGGITMAIGGALKLGALMFLIASSLIFSANETGAAFVICPIVQMVLGCVVIISGILFLRKQGLAKWLLLISVAGILANATYFAMAAFSFFAGQR